MQAIDDRHDKRLKVIVCLGALQGMRRGEILGLKWEDITTGKDACKNIYAAFHFARFGYSLFGV